MGKKQNTIWNASFEESMNLVQEKYIRESINDINENGYHKKILGFIVVDVIMLLIYLFGSRYIDRQESYLPVNTAGLFLVPLIIGVIVTVLYAIRTREIKYNRYLSFYYFYNYMGPTVLAFYFQCSVIGIIGYIRIFGLYSGIALQLLIWVFVIAERARWFYQKTYKALYEREDFKNPLFNRLQSFVSFARKYGWIIILVLTVIRLIAGRGDGSGSGNIGELFVLFFYPLLFVVGYYFVISMCAHSFQGYYLKKYSESYRYLMDYSEEEWYGMKKDESSPVTRFEVRSWGLIRTAFVVLGFVPAFVSFFEALNNIIGYLRGWEWDLFYLCFCLCLTILLGVLGYFMILPKNYPAMDAVGKYMKYSTLKKRIRLENFYKTTECCSLTGRKTRNRDMYVSDKWITIPKGNGWGIGCMRRIYIPRAMIHTLYIRKARVVGGKFRVLMVVTETGKQYPVGYIKEGEQAAVLKAAEERLGKRIYSFDDQEVERFWKKKYSKSRMRRDFERDIKTEQDFLGKI